MVKVLFVCLGNICRSPMAETVFQNMVDDAGLTDEILVDSAGTSSYHIGERAASGTRRVLAKHGLQNNGRSRQVNAADMADDTTYVIAMDSTNLRDLRYRFGEHAHLERLLTYAEQNQVYDVPDPYYEGNFEVVYQLVENGCRGLLAAIRGAEDL